MPPQKKEEALIPEPPKMKKIVSEPPKVQVENLDDTRDQEDGSSKYFQFYSNFDFIIFRPKLTKKAKNFALRKIKPKAKPKKVSKEESFH